MAARPSRPRTETRGEQQLQIRTPRQLGENSDYSLGHSTALRTEPAQSRRGSKAFMARRTGAESPEATVSSPVTGARRLREPSSSVHRTRGCDRANNKKRRAARGTPAR